MRQPLQCRERGTPFASRCRLAVAAACLAGLVLGGCAREPEPVVGPQQVSENDASRRITEQLMRASGDRTGEPTFDLPVVETTPRGAFEALGLQTFRVTRDAFVHETFAVTDAEVRRVGTGLGGPGITAMVFVEQDAGPALRFVTGSGRGVKTYGVGVVDRPGFVPYDPANPVTHEGPPLRVRQPDLAYRDPVAFGTESDELVVTDEGRGVRLGTVALSGDAATFTPADDLPQAVRRRFLRPAL